MTRVIFLGDELVAGYGDPRALGWTGRVMARTITEPPIMALQLAVPGQTIAQLAGRWEGEVKQRLSRDEDTRLVIGLGSHDVDGTESLARCRLHLANILDGADRIHTTSFVVGPPPRHDADNRKVARLAEAYRDVTERRHIPFVDTFGPLHAHAQWNTDMSTSADGYTPRQAGYGLIAWLVLHSGWNSWLGIRTHAE